MDSRKGIHECAVTIQRVNDIGAVQSTREYSDRVGHIENYFNISIPGTNQASFESANWKSKREI